MSTAASNLAPVTAAPRGGLHIALWVVQGLLALAFFMAGAFKATSPLDELVANGMSWVSYSPGWLVRFVGVAEVLGAIGLVLPAATRILPWLTGLAGAGLATIMALAIPMHLTHGEGGLPVNLVLGGLAAFVAWGRLAGRPIPSR
jgi:putative oxidoreductase